MSLIITEEHLTETCQPGNGPKTCAYLMVSPDGWECAKDDPSFEVVILKRLYEGTIRAVGDNCPGWSLLEMTNRLAARKGAQ